MRRCAKGVPVQKEIIPDVLADRYASPAMTAIWSPVGRVVLEREFWIAVMKGQRSLGIDIPAEAIEAYERVRSRVDLESIRARERATRHDVKARIDEFCALAGHEHIHKGLTSRDLTENVEQLQVARSLELVRFKYAACLHRLARRVEEFRGLLLTARTHNVPAQMTTVGKRLAMFGTEMLQAFRRLAAIIDGFPLRGLKGPVGTQLDLLTLFDGDVAKVEALEGEIVRLLGFKAALPSVGQVYPRSVDFEVVGALYQLAAGPSSLATTLRLMAGHELASEGFKADQVGSSAMPHKVNSRNCERICGLAVVLSGYLEMASRLAGDQWNEGDVSCSVVRRVCLPGAMFALDGLLETFLTVLREMTFFPNAIAREKDRNLPFLATTTVLMAAVKGGAGREAAHAAIREHSLAVVRELQADPSARNDLLDRLAADPRVGLSRQAMDRLLAGEGQFTGLAVSQAERFVAEVRALTGGMADVMEYEPFAIL